MDFPLLLRRRIPDAGLVALSLGEALWGGGGGGAGGGSFSDIRPLFFLRGPGSP